MNEVRVCTTCGTTVERDYRVSTDGRAVTTYHVFGAQSQSSGLLEAQHAHWTAGTCPSCGEQYKFETPVRKSQARQEPPENKSTQSVKKTVWLALKVVFSLFMLSCCITDVRDMAWVRGVTGKSLPFLFTLVGYTILFYWAYCVIWIPIKPDTRETRP